MEIGQKVWVETPNDYGDRKPKVEELTIVYIGRKYFAVNTPGRGKKFHLDTLMEATDSNNKAQAFLFKQDLEIYQERKRLIRSLYWGLKDGQILQRLSLDTLRKIHTLLEEKQ